MRSRTARTALAFAVSAAFVGGYVLHDHVGINAAHAQAAAPAGSPAPAMALPDFTAIVASQGPAVVNISVAGTIKTAAPALPEFDPDSPFGEFFRHFPMPGPRGRVPIQGQGSGFILSADGVVLTNAHVVADADEVTVRLTDKREFKAKVVGIDKQSDVAVLRIDAKDLPTVKIGNPDQVRVGEWVLAIGSPFGFENSVTAGIVSAKSRALPDEGYVPFMQTDVAINPGNSGGPLFNARGEVIGINSQIYSRSGGYQGLSFAIPIDVAMNVERQLLDKGKVSRGRLGIAIQEINQGLADSFGLDTPHGALVSSVEPGSPAAKAGLLSGDVILKFNGHDIRSSSELPVLVANTAPGSEAILQVWRKGDKRELKITVGELKAAASPGKDGGSSATGDGPLGLALRPLTRDEKAEVEGGHGLLVERVDDGAAAHAGIQPGDVVLAVNGVRVDHVDQFRTQVGKAGKNLALLVQRGDRSLYVAIKRG